MIRFPKRPRAKSIDLEDGDLVVVGTPSDPGDPEELVDTGVVPPKARATAATAAAAGSSLAPVAMMARAEETFMIPRLERRPPSRVSAIFAAAGQRPSLPWAAALLLLGAIGAAGSMRLLDALDGRGHGDAPAAAAPLPPAPTSALPPIAPPAPAKPGPVVLSFGSADTLRVAVDAPKPAAPPAAPAPPPATVVAPVIAAKKPSPPPAPIAAPAAPPADSVRRAASVDSLAEQQLKAALK